MSYVNTSLFRRVTVTRTELKSFVDTYSFVNGMWMWTKVLGAVDGTVSIWTNAAVLSQVSWLQAVPSKPYEGLGGINAQGQVGIVISAIALLAFIGGVVFCSRKADQAWRAEQQKLMRQQQKGRGRRA
jgi:hypothetical protein